MRIAFYLAEMTFLRYFATLIQEANKRGHDCHLMVGQNQKYNNPRDFEYKLNDLARETLSCSLLDYNTNLPFDVRFCVEGIFPENDNSPVYSLAYMTDYIKLLPGYKDKVDYIVLPSEYYGSFLEEVPDNVLYMGSPKYDNVGSKYYEIQGRQLLEPCHNRRYPSQPPPFSSASPWLESPFALLIHHQKANDAVAAVAQQVSDEGWIPIIKARKKHEPVGMPSCADIFYDQMWFPHDTMSMMSVAGRIINFDSTAVEEAVMMGIMDRFENVEAKDRRHLTELYEEGAKEKYMWDFKSSVAILDHVEQNYLRS